MCLPPVAEGGAAVAGAAFPKGRAPAAKPPFTVGDLRRAIPAHCFERSLLRSSAYLAADLAGAAALYYASTFIDRAPALLAWGLLWPLYGWAPRARAGRAARAPPAGRPRPC